ncbi:Imm64 family immunity protein [Exiguobacterium sp.]|uniref:Imm64 family immunity protein n=1 Tax=Exiguobacterium sp. TaxID=44751 RepID=UPI00263B65D7|nr:Imm64 family immunity protein [Exiguobacterium sp.]MCC5892040.1 hypothetical protein [Exiguobacterium sp.]
MGKSGGFVSIGMAFAKGNGRDQNLRIVCEALMITGGRITRISYSNDEAGNEWVAIEPKDANPDLSHIRYYGTVTLTTNRFGRINQVVTVSLKDELNFDGLLIDLDWEDVFTDTNDTESIASITTSIERLLLDVYQRIPYAYAVAGHEMELDWAPDSFPTSANWLDMFPLSIIPSPEGVAITYGSISIDGMTRQSKKKLSISLDA